MAAIDRVRGDVPRSTWVQRRCEDAIAAHDALRPAKGGAVPAGLREAVRPITLTDLASGPEDEAGEPVDPASVTHVEAEAGSALPEAPVNEPWHVRASAARERQIAAQKAGSKSYGGR